MSRLQIGSVQRPLDTAEVAVRAARLLARLEAMGMLPGRGPVTRLGPDIVRRSVEHLARAGVARNVALTLASMPDTSQAWEKLLAQVEEELELSPMPEHEWDSVTGVLGAERVAALVGVSLSSLRRYAGAERRTPTDVAARLHLVALLLADLAGSYNEHGIRRWFDRPRPQLDGRTPAKVLSRTWSPDDEGPRRVRALAEALAGSPGT